jgi:hypothetical protein
MQVQDNPPPNEEIKKKKRRKKKQNHEEGDSIVDEVADGCFFDGCFFLSWMPWDFDGCVPDFDGCSIGDGCSFDGCSFDGCSMLFLPFRLMIILGLMLYGDWDYKHWRAKI